MSRKLTPEEKSLWRSIAGHIAPIHPQKEMKVKVEAAEKRQMVLEKKIKQKPDRPKMILPLFSKPQSPAQEMDDRTRQRFRRGQMPMEATLDLHGHSVMEAQFTLQAFLRDAYKRQLRCVLVIHGKGSITGEAKIKKALPLWLGDIPDIILAHAPAKPQHGGLGASYVLLRRKRVTL